MPPANRELAGRCGETAPSRSRLVTSASCSTKPKLIVAIALAFLVTPRPGTAQTSTHRFLPEVDLYFQRDERLRFIVQSVATLDTYTPSNQGSFTGFVELAMRPLLRVGLRHDNDVFRKR